MVIGLVFTLNWVFQWLLSQSTMCISDNECSNSFSNIAICDTSLGWSRGFKLVVKLAPIFKSDILFVLIVFSLVSP